MRFRGRLIAEDNPELAESREDIRAIQKLEVTISRESHDVVQKIIYAYTNEGTRRLTLPMRRDHQDLYATVLVSGNGQGNLYNHLQSDVLTYIGEYRKQHPQAVGRALIGLELEFNVGIKKYTFTHPQDASIRISGLKFVLTTVSVCS